MKPELPRRGSQANWEVAGKGRENLHSSGSLREAVKPEDKRPASGLVLWSCRCPSAEPKVRAERGGKARGKCTPRLFEGRVIGAPVARANIPCEALGAGLQSLKLPPLPLVPPPPPSCFHLRQWAAGWVSDRAACTPTARERGS